MNSGTGGPTHRVAIVGTGMVANWHVAGWRNAGAEVAAAVDAAPGVLHSFCETHGIEHGYPSLDAFLATGRAHEVDIVDICTPPWLHAPMAIAASGAGYHVLVEKPFALTAAEGYAMAEAAERTGTIIACRQGQTRLEAESRTVAGIVRSGILGDIYAMRLTGRSLYRPGIEYNPAARWFLDRARAGGGALYDWGVYDLELLYSMVGPIEVQAVAATVFTGIDDPHLDVPFDVEEHAMGMLTLTNGTRIVWDRAWATHLPPEHRWEFYGTEAGLSFVPHNAQLGVEAEVRLTRYAPTTAIELPTPPVAPPGPTVYADFLHAIDTGSIPASPARECAHMLGVIARVYEAAGRDTAPEGK